MRKPFRHECRRPVARDQTLSDLTPQMAHLA